MAPLGPRLTSPALGTKFPSGNSCAEPALSGGGVPGRPKPIVAERQAKYNRKDDQ